MSIPFGVEIPFVHLLGITMERFEGGHSELHYTPRSEHMNSFNVVHGGVTMTLMDVCMATAARSARLESGVVTIEMKTSFMRSARGPLVCKGRLMQGTAHLAFTEATVYDAQGQALSHATGTFKYVARQPVARDSSTLKPISTD